MGVLPTPYQSLHPIGLNDYRRDYTTWHTFDIVYTRLAYTVLLPYYYWYAVVLLLSLIEVMDVLVQVHYSFESWDFRWSLAGVLGVLWGGVCLG